ncbi:MAG: DUF2177 family protein [Parasphingorhabdus sp.]|nr:DUF2177 family protein [Parasphingorhabdus sp.]
MTKYFAAYGIAAIIFGILDAIWLSQAGPKLYRPLLGEILAENFRLMPALIFYALYLIGIVWFGVRPALISGQWTDAVLNGALFGALAYATYDLTNQATLKIWSSKVTVIDIGWGAFATGTAAALTAIIVLRVLKV